jgi:anaerobic dimethyl sulfoxide reductase subunit C (anchor subunit)
MGGILASCLHLGQPFSAWKSLLNLSHSRLSLEILLTLLFAVCALVNSVSWMTGRTEFRVLLDMGTFLFGLAAVVSSAAVYMVDTQPMWNSGWLPTSFLGTMLLLAGAAGAVCASSANAHALLPWFLDLAIAGGLLSCLSALWMRNLFLRLSNAKTVFVNLPEWPDRRNLGPWLSFGLWVLLAGVLPVAVAILLMLFGNSPAQTSAFQFAPSAIVLILAGGALGRRLMYWMGTALSRF